MTASNEEGLPVSSYLREGIRGRELDLLITHLRNAQEALESVMLRALDAKAGTHESPNLDHLASLRWAGGRVREAAGLLESCLVDYGRT